MNFVQITLLVFSGIFAVACLGLSGYILWKFWEDCAENGNQNVTAILFSLKGRTTRSVFGPMTVTIQGLFIVSTLGTVALSTYLPSTALFAPFIFLLPIFWISFAMQTKRLHDINLPGAIAIFPILGWYFAQHNTILPAVSPWLMFGYFVYFLFLLFYKGTNGTNKYGQNPLIT